MKANTFRTLLKDLVPNAIIADVLVKSQVPSVVSLNFNINYNTVWGENIVVVGSLPELGNFNPQHGFKLNWYNGNWNGKLAVRRYLAPFYYKYVVVNDDGNVLWEQGNDRSFTQYSYNEFTLNDSWNM